MTRGEYLRLVAAISDRWATGQWTEAMVETWWPQFENHDVVVGLKAIEALQRDGHGPFAPDPGLVLRHLRASVPGGARYAVGRHATALAALEAERTDRKTSQKAISAFRAALTEARSRGAANVAENAAETS